MKLLKISNMKIYTDFSAIENADNVIVTIGTFDGVHKGHLKILEDLSSKAAEINGETFVVTFEPHPRSVITANFKNRLLTTLDEKIELLEGIGIDHLMVINFTREFSTTTAEEFISEFIVDKIGAKHLVIGYDHKFGKDRIGDENFIRKIAEGYNLGVTTVPAVSVNGELVSSTKIRNLIAEGDIEKASLYLGRNYRLSGIVTKGAGRGAQLGFATANLTIKDESKLIPKRGVYAVSCEINSESYFGLMNIGFRPTFETDGALTLEAHLFDFDRDIYDVKLNVSFLRRIRDEMRFNSMEALAEQIEIDKKETLEVIRTLTN